MTDMEKAEKITAKYAPFIGGASLEHNIARAVAEGIALGRQEGLALAAKSTADEMKEPG
jgi:hypothetical protein